MREWGKEREKECSVRERSVAEMCRITKITAVSFVIFMDVIEIPNLNGAWCSFLCVARGIKMY